MSRWAVFDVDGSMLPGTSMEKLFLVYLMKRGILPLRSLWYYGLSAFMSILREGSDDAFKNNKMYLKDLPISPVQRVARRLFREQIFPALSPRALQEWNQRRQAGYRLLLMSGSPDFLTGELASHLHPDAWVATHPEIHARHFTGKVTGLHPYGERKTAILQQLQQELDIDFDQSVVFANHHTDAHHMALFGQAVAVNPTPRLEQIARRAQWPVVWWQ